MYGFLSFYKKLYYCHCSQMFIICMCGTRKGFEGVISILLHQKWLQNHFFKFLFFTYSVIYHLRQLLLFTSTANIYFQLLFVTFTESKNTHEENYLNIFCFSFNIIIFCLLFYTSRSPEFCEKSVGGFIFVKILPH